MRVFRFLCVAVMAAGATAFLAGRNPRVADAQEPPKVEPKKEADKKEAIKIDKVDEDILARAKLSTAGDALVDFLKKRVLPETDRPQIERLVRQLGSTDFRVRERANQELIARGTPALDILRTVNGSAPDCEVMRRLERSIQQIHDRDVPRETLAAAIRVAALQQPKAFVEALIGYAPYAETDAELDELRAGLAKHAFKDGKADPLLTAALADRSPARRALAGETLGRVAFADHKDALRKLLGDPDAAVRYRLARALVFARERDAVPTLIDAIPDLPINTAWQAEDLLLKLATGQTAPTAAMGNTTDAREKCKAAWQEWWKKHGDKVDLAKLEDTPKMLNRTLIVLLDQNAVLELGPDNLPRFEIKGLTFPLDAQMIDDNRVLVAEYHAMRVTERNLRGEVLWTKAVAGDRPGVNSGGPQVAQRLPSGNTFIATANRLLEYDKDDNLVVNIRVAEEGEQKIMKAMKLASGEIVCLQTDARIVRYDAKGNETHSFPINIGMRLFGGRIHMLPTGRVLVPLHAEGKVVEYDSRGKIIWEVPFEQPIVATRLPNGNTLITSMNPWVGAVEVDRTGAHVWSYRHSSNTRVTRAIRR
jgi:hypothetical protein